MILLAKQSILVLLATALAGSCGLGPFSEEGGGSDHLPLHGGGPFRTLGPDFDTPADEPYVVAQPIVSLLDPSVRQNTDGSFKIHYTTLSDMGSEIWQIDLPSIRDLPQSPRLVLGADQAWEQGRVASATILYVNDDRQVLYYEGGVETRAIGRAFSTDGGNTFAKDPNNPVVDGLDPYVLAHDGLVLLVYADVNQQHIVLQTSNSPDGGDWGPPRQLIAARSNTPEAFDRLGVKAPALRITQTLDGQLHYGLYYTGMNLNSDDEVFEAIGYQASFGGEIWERFLAGEPIVEPGPAGAGGPAPIIGPNSGFLFFYQFRQGRGRIAVSVSP